MQRGSVKTRFSYHFHHLPGGEKHLELRRGRSLGRKANLKKPLVDMKPLPPPASLGDKTILEPRLDLPLAERRMVRGNEREGRHEENEERPGDRGSFMGPPPPSRNQKNTGPREAATVDGEPKRSQRSAAATAEPSPGERRRQKPSHKKTLDGQRMILAGSARNTQRPPGKDGGRRRRRGRPKLASGTK